MNLRRITWSEFRAWVLVTKRDEARRRSLFVRDAFHAAQSDGEHIQKHLEQLDG